MVTYIGKKIGMTRGFTEGGEAFPISVIEIQPNTVLSILPSEEEAKVKIGAFPVEGKKNKLFRMIKEFTVAKDEAASLKEGQALSIEEISKYSHANIEGTSKGKGFSGVIKRHGFARGPESHGSDHHRHPGSIGCAFPQRVIAGRKMPGHLGAVKVTTKNLQIIGIDKEKQAILIKGAVPGPRKGNLIIRVFNK